MMVDADSGGGGFAVEFVSPANNEENKCPICLLTLKKPVQAIPCGHRFCKECIDTVRANNRYATLLCPEDRGKIQIFPDAAKEREILNSKIKCTNQSGCGWNGEMRQLQDHLRECDYEKIMCKNPQCFVLMERRNENVHLQTECRYRIVKCPFCADFYLYINEKLHQQNCVSFPVECNNKCGEVSIPRNQMEKHTRENCRNSILKCQYADIGCNTEGTRATLKEHMKANTEQHLNYAIERLNSYEQKFADMERRLSEMETLFFNRHHRDENTDFNNNTLDVETLEVNAEIEHTHDQPNLQCVAQRTEPSGENSRGNPATNNDSWTIINNNQSENYANLRAMLPTCPFFSTIKDFDKEFTMAKRENKKVYSKPFYCLGGYRGQMKIFLNGWGSGKNTHVSVYLKFLIGPFNDILDWPFRGLITISVHNERQERHEKIMNTDKMQQESSEVFQKPMAKPTQGKGFSKFLSHKQMERFIVNNEMTFSVNISPL